MVKRLCLILAVVVLGTASVLLDGSRGSPSAVAKGKYFVVAPNIASDAAPVPTPQPPAQDLYVTAVIEKTITNMAHTSTLRMRAKGIHPTVVEPPVTASGDPTVKDELTGLSEGCTSRVTMPNTNLRMILEPSDPSDAEAKIRLRFTGAIVWGLDLDCKGQPVIHFIKDITVTDMLGPAMKAYYSSYGRGYAFNPERYQPSHPSINQCVLRKGHFEGVDAQGPQTTQVILDLYVTRGDCPLPSLGAAD